VQIFVLVATIQTRIRCLTHNVNHFIALKAVVEKVSLTLANKQGLVGPKSRGNPLKMTKGKKVNIPSLFYSV